MCISIYRYIFRLICVYCIYTQIYIYMLVYKGVYVYIQMYRRCVKDPENRTQIPMGSTASGAVAGAGKLLMCWCGHGRMGTS